MRPYKGYIQEDKNFRILFENSVMLVGNLVENSYCINKLTKEEFAIFQFENDPTCALVAKSNDWCLIGGDILVLRTWIDNTLRLIGNIEQIFGLKRISKNKVQILTDPWSENSAIWQLTINLEKLSNPTKLEKVRDFKEYIDKPYCENLSW